MKNKNFEVAHPRPLFPEQSEFWKCFFFFFFLEGVKLENPAKVIGGEHSHECDIHAPLLFATAHLEVVFG